MRSLQISMSGRKLGSRQILIFGLDPRAGKVSMSGRKLGSRQILISGLKLRARQISTSGGKLRALKTVRGVEGNTVLAN